MLCFLPTFVERKMSLNLSMCKLLGCSSCPTGNGGGGGCGHGEGLRQRGPELLPGVTWWEQQEHLCRGHLSPDPGRDAPSLCDLTIPPSCKTAMMRTPVAQCTVSRRAPETSWWQSLTGSNNFLEMYFCVLHSAAFRH